MLVFSGTQQIPDFFLLFFFFTVGMSDTLIKLSSNEIDFASSPSLLKERLDYHPLSLWNGKREK